MIHTRTCNTCHIDKPIEEFYRTGKWHERRCKECTLKLDRERDSSLPKVQYGSTRQCALCKRTLPIECFPVLRKRYRMTKCFDCRNALASVYYHKHKNDAQRVAKRQEAQHRFRQRNPDYGKRWMRTRRRTNPDYGKTAAIPTDDDLLSVQFEDTISGVPDRTSRKGDG